MIIQSRNILAEQPITPVTYLTNNESAGTNVLRWANPNGFNTSWAIQVGKTGEEQTEVVVLGASTPSGTAGTLTANTLYEHPANTPIYGIKFNQIVFERSTAGTSGTATPMTNGTITYQPDKAVTIFDDTSGSTSYAYRTYFRNSVLAVNSTESDWITSEGFTFYSLARIRERVKNKLWNANFVTDEMIDEWTNEWKETLRREAIAVNEDYSLGTVAVAFGTSGLGTITSSDYKGMVQRMWITYDSAGTYKAVKMDLNNFYPSEDFSKENPYYAMQGDSVILVKPEEEGGTAHIVYPTLEVPLDSDTEEVPVYMRDHTKSFVDYGLIQAQYKDGKISLNDKIILENALKATFKQDIAPRKRTGPTTVNIVDSVSSEDYQPL